MLRSFCEAGAAGAAILDVLQGAWLPHVIRVRTTLPHGVLNGQKASLTSRLPDDPINFLEHGEEAIKELNADFGIPASFYRVDVRDHVAVEEAVNGIVRD